MHSRKFFRSAFLAAGVLLIAACASQPASSPTPVAEQPTPAATATPAATPSMEAKPEADAAAQLEKKFQEAARSYRAVQKDGQTMYCKKEKPMGSTIPRVQCITEAQLRLQVEQMDDLRDRMRNSSKCARGPSGCSGGG